MPAQHDGDLGAQRRVQAGHDVRVEDDAERILGVLRKGHAARDEIAEAAHRQQGRVAVVQVHDHDGDHRNVVQGRNKRAGVRQHAEGTGSHVWRSGADDVRAGCFDCAFEMPNLEYIMN